MLIEHVLHVATIAATLCRGLARGGWELDGELAYAGGLGHDLGHAPFGHSGERELQKKLGDRQRRMEKVTEERMTPVVMRTTYKMPTPRDLMARRAWNC